MRALNAKKGLIVKSILFIAAVVLAATGVFFGFVKKTTDSNNPKLTSKVKSQGAPPSVVEKSIDTPSKDALSKKDYESYQSYQRSIALQYFYNNDTTNAERVMNDVFKNVPADKVASTSYLMMASIQEKKHDVDQQKKYLQAAIDKLKAEGNPDQAANEQKVLDEL